MLRETLYAAFQPEKGHFKHVLYQWSLPEGGARQVAESISHTCMAEHCGRHFGLLGELCLHGTDHYLFVVQTRSGIAVAAVASFAGMLPILLKSLLAG